MRENEYCHGLQQRVKEHSLRRTTVQNVTYENLIYGVTLTNLSNIFYLKINAASQLLEFI